jgi:hypothetical protein
MKENGIIMFSDSNKLKELFIEAINSEDTNKIILYFFIYFLNKDLDLEREISKTTNKLYEQFIEIEKNNKEKLKNFEKIIIKNKI